MKKSSSALLGIALAFGALDGLRKRSPKERDQRTEADIAERIEKQRQKLARRAANHKGRHQ